MPGPVPGIHVLGAAGKGVDGRDKPGHDGVEATRPSRERHVRCPATSRRGERNALMAVIKPDFIAPNMISAGFSSVCGLAKNARCT
jgi:hypothetical protein